MRFKVTPLGSSGQRSLGQVVNAIVDYLSVPQEPSPAPNQGSGGTPGAGDPVRYYADRGEGPGRWLGAQAAASGLSGTVEAEDFSSVLAGRDPRTGERLISARGSAGRRGDLGSGNESRWDSAGRRLFDPHDAAAVLGVSVREATRMMEVGAIIAVGRLWHRDAERDTSALLTSDGDGKGTGSRVRPAPVPERPVDVHETVPSDHLDHPLPADPARPGPRRPDSGHETVPSEPVGRPVSANLTDPVRDRPEDGHENVPSKPDDRPGPSVLGPDDAVRSSGDGTVLGRPSRSEVGGSGRDLDAAPLQPEGSYLVPVIDRDGTMWVTDQELGRCEDARREGPDPGLIAGAGEPGDTIPLTEAARLVGVTGRYLRRLAGRWESQRDVIEATLAEGREPHQAWIPAHRGTRDRWFVRRQDLVEFVQRRRPPAVRVGYDLTLTTEKSLSVLALLSEPEVRDKVLDAIRGGNDTALGWFETRASTTRVKGQPVEGAGWTVASFQHLTSRALDPFPHHHNVVANTVVGPDGQRRALDARDLYRHAQGASAIATVEMRHRLADLGVRWRIGTTGSWEIDGISDEVLREFSQRRTEIDDALSELEDAIGRGVRPDDVDHIALKTRPPKQRRPVDDLSDQWWQRARALGLTPEGLARTVGRDHDRPRPGDDAVFAGLVGPAGVCAHTSVFGRNELLVALAHLGVPDADGTVQPLAEPATDLEALADRFLDSPHVIALAESEGRDDCLFTTAEALATQQRIVDRHLDGLATGHGEVAPRLIAASLALHPQLSGEQRRLVRSFCLSGDRIQCAIGRAGAGKTTTMAAAVDAWQSAGYKVIGAAVKGEAARTLAAATGIECETIAWHLARPDPERSALEARTVLVVDEASTISDFDLDRLAWLAERTGATIRLVGDPAQHGAVAAGGMFRVLCEHEASHTPELTESHRLRHPADRVAVDALRDGRIAEAFDTLAAAGHLHIATDELDTYRQMLTRWWNAHQAGDHHPMVDRRNTTRHQLNRLAHRLLQANGEIGTEEIVATGDRRFSVGDRVTARTPARHLHPDADPTAYVRNGAVGTVIALHERRNRSKDRITVAFDDLGPIDLPRSFFDEHQGIDGRRQVGIDLAYALTSYAVQGATFDSSTSRVDEGATRPEAYVDTTRGRNANHLYLTRSADPLDGEHLPMAPPRPVAAAITDRLSRSGPQPTAWELSTARSTAADPHRPDLTW